MILAPKKFTKYLTDTLKNFGPSTLKLSYLKLILQSNT